MGWRRWLLRAGIAQAVSWASFAAALYLFGFPVWVPTPVTLFFLSLKGAA